jgi:hypothetical protein
MAAMLEIRAAAVLSLLLAGCAGAAGGGWTKDGADAAEAASAYQDCLALTQTATQTDAQIDQDIAATRASDVQRASILHEQAQQMAQDSRDRAAAIIGSCMQARGFTQRPR